ncbi:hypothetical protein ABGB18_38540 [Nonomuraea sp. B12E4]|uniref:hypothetical protein n=1 Tax=Nonomuraea sp. B12E4 TaxID=3153564 RepID=UPI00325DA09E
MSPGGQEGVPLPRGRCGGQDRWALPGCSPLGSNKIPESERDRRHALRTTLAEMGFGTASPGVWVASGTLHDHE